MEIQYKINDIIQDKLIHVSSGTNDNNVSPILYPGGNINPDFEKRNLTDDIFQNNLSTSLEDLLKKMITSAGKKSFLVFKHNKYMTVPTSNIAFFHVKYETSFIVSFDRQEYAVNYSLEQIQHLLSDRQFFRLNRQYLVNFNAVKEVEHYFARKLLVTLTIPAPEKLLIAKEKTSSFLQWLENR